MYIIYTYLPSKTTYSDDMEWLSVVPLLYLKELSVQSHMFCMQLKTILLPMPVVASRTRKERVLYLFYILLYLLTTTLVPVIFEGLCSVKV